MPDVTVPTVDCDVLVVGSGIAGCAAALAAAREGADVLVVTKASEPDDAATDWAQGGIAVTRSDPETFAADIRAAGDGECDPAAVETLVHDAREAIEDVLVDTLGVPFDERDGDAGDDDASDGDPDRVDAAGYDLAREAAHSERRVLHVDAETGRHVLRPFLRHLRDRRAVRLREDTAVLDLLADEGRVTGATIEPPADAAEDVPAAVVRADATVLATGGVGALFPEATGPAGATGDGIATAALAGADVRDMQYVQFHPTALDTDDPAVDGDADGLLISEAVRGEGARLVNADGERFMPAVHADGELAPRDVVARAVARERDRTGGVRLAVADVDFAEEFPGLAAGCRERGVDPADGIPVRPAEHFLCGGVAVDERGRTSLARLYAAGECARTGVHGANRLASTSLLEGLVWGRRAGADAAGRDPLDDPVDPPTYRDRDPTLPGRFADDKFRRLRGTMGEAFGLERDRERMAAAAGSLRRLKGEVDAYTRTRTSRELYELRNAAVTALLIARDAVDAPSAGCHRVVDRAGGDGAGRGAGDGEAAAANGGDGRAD
ncbi:FAD-dependent oxidoreductase [Halobaculum sp. WSA2]|uniref:L-aspartate oxidase n=1 Tax=Halobaculum saliterrae TaxID=2073113 RepID=A0A6B0SSH3_9EURY|nr:FAD-dependent oxidoreductase [Halobaculum saliterrae]MXR41605.1 FAD-dependent oxidoreductase [Halobaculum saliterrae]